MQDRLTDAIKERGAQIRIYGDTGVGKTSLVTFAANDVGAKMLTVSCMSSHDFGSILEESIKQIRGVRLSSYKTTRLSSAEAEGTGGYKFLASIRGKYSFSGGREKSFEIVEQTPVDLLIELMKNSGYKLLVLDNFQNVSDSYTRSLVAQLMEKLADDSDERAVSMVVIGIADDAKTLLGDSGSIRRRTTDIGVPRMPDDEIKEIFRAGFKILGLQIGTDLLEQLIFFSDGFPFFAHSLGLNVARAARHEGSRFIDRSVFAAGLVRCVREVDATYTDRVLRGEEAGGGVQPRKKILALLAGSRDREWTSADIERLWLERYGLKGGKKPVINPALGQLVKPEMGAILCRVNDRRPFRYRFEDPHFRPYLRLREAANLTGPSGF